MIIVDRALNDRESQGNPIAVGMVGAGHIGRAITNQICNSAAGVRLTVIVNRDIEAAVRAFREAGVEPTVVESRSALDDVVSRGGSAVTDDPQVATRSETLEALLEATGTVEHAARVVTDAIAHGKHIVLVNAEVDGTVGPILKTYADRAGVVYTGADGDQPAVEMNLYRYVRSVGLEPLVCGNIKGLEDPYRNPTTQEAFAREWGQRPTMVTSFADGTKISFEQALVANATAMRVARRGMGGGDHSGHVDS